MIKPAPSTQLPQTAKATARIAGAALTVLAVWLLVSAYWAAITGSWVRGFVFIGLASLAGQSILAVPRLIAYGEGK